MMLKKRHEEELINKIRIMKTKELRIGNLLDHSGEIAEVSSLHSDDTLRIFSKDKKTTYGCFAARIFKPIKLTEDILLKCGFEKKDSNYFEYPYGTQSRYIMTGLNFGTTELCSGSISTALFETKYLHQLQNLYFTLTQTELKVDIDS